MTCLVQRDDFVSIGLDIDPNENSAELEILCGKQRLRLDVCGSHSGGCTGYLQNIMATSS